MPGRSLNRVQLIGHLGSDPESRFLDNGTTLTSFRVATTRSWMDNQTNQRREHTDWHSVVSFGRVAEIANQYLRRGSKVYLEGYLQTRTYDREGQTHYRTEINLRELIMLDRAPQEGSYERSPSMDGNRDSDIGQSHHNASAPSNTGQQGGFDSDQDNQLDDDIPF